MCRGCLKNTFINHLKKRTYMGKFIGLATGCANGFTMLALGRQCCCGTDCSGDALWYAAQMQRGCSEVAARFRRRCTDSALGVAVCELCCNKSVVDVVA